MLWSCMPVGERIADWVTWNLFLFFVPHATHARSVGTSADAFT